MAGGAGPIATQAAPEVDVPTAKELIEQIHQHVSTDEIARLVDALAGKVASIRRLLVADDLDARRVRAALEWTFVARRRASAIMAARSDEHLASWVEDLLHGPEALTRRFERFCAAAGALRSYAAAELASELLHFAYPERYWLWSRWVWNPDSRTGALPLLIGEDYDLDVPGGLGAQYERVCEALSVLDASAEASAFRLRGGGRLATDVMLACTYGVYMRTVLGLKMTQEFNALVPPMGDLARRLLGVHARHEEVM